MNFLLSGENGPEGGSCYDRRIPIQCSNQVHLALSTFTPLLTLATDTRYKILSQESTVIPLFRNCGP